MHYATTGSPLVDPWGPVEWQRSSPIDPNVPVEPVAPAARPNDRPKVTNDSDEERQHRPPHRVGHAYALEAQ